MEYSRQLLTLLAELLKILTIVVALYLIGIMIEANFDFREWALITRWGFAISFLMLLDYSDDKKLLEWLKKTIKDIYSKVNYRVKQFRQWY
jgi:hypothetical protein